MKFYNAMVLVTFAVGFVVVVVTTIAINFRRLEVWERLSFILNRVSDKC